MLAEMFFKSTGYLIYYPIKFIMHKVMLIFSVIPGLIVFI